jgi:hypothetical protein
MMNMGVLRWELASWRGAAWLPVRRKRKARERCVDFIVESSVYLWLDFGVRNGIFRILFPESSEEFGDVKPDEHDTSNI